LKPKWVDVDHKTANINIQDLKYKLGPTTKAGTALFHSRYLQSKAPFNRVDEASLVRVTNLTPGVNDNPSSTSLASFAVKMRCNCVDEASLVRVNQSDTRE
jgi:hypothetical protein